MRECAKREPRPGKGFGQAPIMVEYHGEQRKLRDLRYLAGGVSPGALRAWWIKEGSPPVVDDDFFSRYLESKRITRLDGVVATYEQISNRFQCSPSAVSSLVKTHGRDLTSAMFAAIRAYKKKKRVTREYSRPTTPVERKQLDSIPSAGTWEEKHLAACGKNWCGNEPSRSSFSGVKSDGRGCYNGRQ